MQFRPAAWRQKRRSPRSSPSNAAAAWDLRGKAPSLGCATASSRKPQRRMTTAAAASRRGRRRGCTCNTAERERDATQGISKLPLSAPSFSVACSDNRGAQQGFDDGERWQSSPPTRLQSSPPPPLEALLLCRWQSSPLTSSSSAPPPPLARQRERERERGFGGNLTRGRWWTGLGLIESLPFSRDRLVENYLWAVGIAFEPQYSNVRVWLTKLICVLTVIDDVYDVYGSLGELELFTEAVERWKPEAAEMLPEYMKPCFLALHGLVNETAREISRNIQGWDAMPFVCKEWQRLCKGYLLEAKWFNNGYKPPLTKYLDNAWITIGGPIAMVHCYLLRPSPIPHKLADCLGSNQALKLISVSSLITRISDDLGTSNAEMERGDTSKTLDCFMEEWGESEDNAREHIKGLVGELWRELNQECHRINSAGELPRDFVRMVVNMSRAAQCVFQYGDGIGTSTGITKDRIISLFVEGID